MKAAFLIGERALRVRYAKCLESADAVIDEFPTASKALTELERERYDLVVIHWKVFPGFGSGDERIDELASLLPDTEFNRNLFYWEVGLRVIDLMRDEESPNLITPVVAVFPNLQESGFGIGDQLTRESVRSDIDSRRPARAVFGPSITDFSDAVAELLPEQEV